MAVALVVITHNRLEYTMKCLARLVENPKEEFELYLWDNASADRTPEYLMDGFKDPRIIEVFLSKENLGQTAAMNYAWSKTKAELVGKLDNDCLVTPGWTQILAKAHHDIDELGAAACWHYPLDELDERKARKAGKIQSFRGHQLLRHPWVCGSGFLMKHSTYKQYGEWQPGADVGTTGYFLRMAVGGKVNGWYFPPVLQEHMDDPRSQHSMVTNDESVRRWYDVTYTLRTKKISNMEERWKRREVVLANLNSGPWRAEAYIGWRAKWNNAAARIGSLWRKLINKTVGICWAH
jgi:glycosyltransferase involved in cell wall biosynthesis